MRFFRVNNAKPSFGFTPFDKKMPTKYLKNRTFLPYPLMLGIPAKPVLTPKEPYALDRIYE
jgi:hypothetical protein